MDNLTKLLLEKGYVTIDQLILLNLGRDTRKSKTIDDLRKELDIARTTLVDHLNKLENDGLITIRKSDREKRIYPVPNISEKLVSIIEDFIKNYKSLIVHATKTKAKQLESLGK